MCRCGECDICRKAMFDDEMATINARYDTPAQAEERKRLGMVA